MSKSKIKKEEVSIPDGGCFLAPTRHCESDDHRHQEIVLMFSNFSHGVPSVRRHGRRINTYPHSGFHVIDMTPIIVLASKRSH